MGWQKSANCCVQSQCWTEFKGWRVAMDRQPIGYPILRRRNIPFVLAILCRMENRLATGVAGMDLLCHSLHKNFDSCSLFCSALDPAQQRVACGLSSLPYSIVSWYLPILGLYISGFLLLWEGPYVLECTKNPVSVPQFPSFLNNYRRRLCLFSTFKIEEYLLLILAWIQ